MAEDRQQLLLELMNSYCRLTTNGSSSLLHAISKYPIRRGNLVATLLAPVYYIRKAATQLYFIRGLISRMKIAWHLLGLASVTQFPAQDTYDTRRKVFITPNIAYNNTTRYNLSGLPEVMPLRLVHGKIP